MQSLIVACVGWFDQQSCSTSRALRCLPDTRLDGAPGDHLSGTGKATVSVQADLVFLHCAPDLIMLLQITHGKSKISCQGICWSAGTYGFLLAQAPSALPPNDAVYPGGIV